MKKIQTSYQETHSYQLPPEWALQSGVMLTWPHQDSDWAPWLPLVELEFVAMAQAIADREKLLVSCLNPEIRAHVITLLSDAGAKMENVVVWVVPSDDTWVRDHGPITVLDKEGHPRLLDFIFNGWGGKFSAERDNLLTRHLHQQGAFGGNPLESIPMVLEGGGIETDGQGTLLTTSSCLLSQTRNPELEKAGVERKLKDLLGVKRFLWLDEGGLEGDDTDGHIDTLVRFTDESTLCYVSCDDPTDPHFKGMAAMARQLREFTDYKGEAYRLIPLPWPSPKFSASGKRLPATYANFLIINGAVLVPTYNDPADAIALAQLRECFPDREVIGISCRTLIEQYGSLHCVTMQLPFGVLS